MGILLNKSKNYIINGAMDFWQRGTSFAAIAANTYNADRFAYSKTGAMVHTLTRDADVPTFAQSGFIFPFSLRLALTTPDTSLAAGEFCILRHKIEGQIFAPLSNKIMTLSFWVKATIAGTYSVSMRNAAQDRSLVKSFTILAADTWEKKSLTIQHDNSGTWLYDNGSGLDISWTVAAASNLSTASDGVWIAGNFIGLTGQLNGVNTGSTNFRIAGVQLEEGSSASNFERAGGMVINEHTLCKRYYQFLNVYRRRINGSTMFDGADIVPMRVYPTLSGGSITDNGTLVLNAITPTVVGYSDSLYLNGTVVATSGGVHQVVGNLDSEL